MKKLLLLLLTLPILMLSCSGGGSNPLDGTTWTFTEEGYGTKELKFTQKEYTYTHVGEDGSIRDKSTESYTYSESVAKMNITNKGTGEVSTVSVTVANDTLYAGEVKYVKVKK